jgi:tRNA (mo5U34)-methyltransferase
MGMGVQGQPESQIQPGDAAEGKTATDRKYWDAAAIRERIKGLHWAHPVDLGFGIVTRPEWYVRRRFERRKRLMQIPANLQGWSVLDIGAWDGYFSWECERRGADRVLAIDTYAWDHYGMGSFLAAREILGSKVEYMRRDVHDLTPENTGRFDLVMMFGVFYHLRNPLLGLERIASVTKKLLICETHVLLPFIHEKYPLVPFFRGDGVGPKLKYEMCAIPTLECLKQMFEAVGAKKVTVKYTPSFRMWKKFLALLKNRPQSGRAILHVEF